MSSQRKEVAAFVKNHDQELVFRAASKYKFTKDAPYVMRLIKRKPEVASKIKKWYQLERKKKGITISSIGIRDGCSYVIGVRALSG